MEGTFRKEIIDNQLFLFNGKGELIFKRWLKRNTSVVLDIVAYRKADSFISITDKNHNGKN